MRIDCNGYKLHFAELNSRIRDTKDEEIEIVDCVGQRYIGAGSSGKRIKITGVPGNALGAYLDGSEIEIFGNGQDAVGDTMNSGKIIIHGSIGDAAGYAMRGGEIYVEKDAGYRAGIHMKAYKDKLPVLVVGGVCGSFLGEYQAGGIIVALGLGAADRPIAGFMCGTGMHGGKIYLRAKEENMPKTLPAQVKVKKCTEEDKAEILNYVKNFCDAFDRNLSEIMGGEFYLLTPDTKNPYKQLYTNN